LNQWPRTLKERYSQSLKSLWTTRRRSLSNGN
jgi:hypothetical protein